MKFKVIMKMIGESALVGNGLRFNSRADAMKCADDLQSRSMKVESYKIVKTDEPIVTDPSDQEIRCRIATIEYREN